MGYVWTCPKATTTRVVDGDSWWMTLDLGWRIAHSVYIRLAGVDAAGHGEPVRKQEATRLIRDLLMPATGPVVCFVTSHELDKYGRTLADVTLPDGSDLGRILVASGLGVPWDGRGPHPPGGGA